MRTIALTNGLEAIVDDADYDYIASFRWYFSSGYAHTRIYFREENGMRNRDSVAMHLLINGYPIKGLVTDHINRNKLDNRRCNLRVVSHSVNSLNRDYCDQARRKRTAA